MVGQSDPGKDRGGAGVGRLRMVTTDTLGEVRVRPGGVVHAAAVSGANVLRDMREAITNTIGGKMVRYEKLLDQTITRALEALEANARAAGYDAVVGLRISHPVITDGAIEILAIGTGVYIVGDDHGTARPGA